MSERITLLISLLLFIGSAQTIAADPIPTEIKVALYSEGNYPPYFFKDSSNGILIEVFEEIATKQGYRISLNRLPRKRATKMMNQGEVDATPLARQWAENPDDFEFTEPVVEARDVLFYLSKKALKFDSISDLHGMTLGTRLGFVYPTLEEKFATGKIVRSDVTSELAMLKMVLSGRMDAVVLNQHVGLWLIRENSWQGLIKASENSIDSFGFSIMFNRKWKDLVAEFNRELAVMKQSGKIEMISSKYQ